MLLPLSPYVLVDNDQGTLTPLIGIGACVSLCPLFQFVDCCGFDLLTEE